MDQKRVNTMPDYPDLSLRAGQIFAMNGGSWRDYALVADIKPPRIVRALPSIGLLDIADEALADACRQYLIEQGAQTFATFDELTNAFGIQLPGGDGKAAAGRSGSGWQRRECANICVAHCAALAAQQARPLCHVP